VQPTPRWEMTGSEGTLTLDKHAMLKNVVLSVKDVPLFYVPAIYYPINKEDRSTGFLLPTYGSSTFRGTSLSNAFFWAISRSQDATFYHDWYAKTGQGIGTDYRYVYNPGSRGEAKFYLIDDRANPTTAAAAHRSYRLDADGNQGLPHGFRLIGRTSYFDDVSTQQSYQNIADFSQRQRYYTVSLTGSVGRYRLSASADSSDVLSDQTHGARTGHGPLVDFTVGEKPIRHTKVYLGAWGETAYLIRQNDISDPTTNRSLWRMDSGASVRAPLSSLSFLTATGSASWRLTRWQESIDPITNTQVPLALNRQLFDFRMQVVGPTISRVFQTPTNGYAQRIKHVIEPSLEFQRTSSFSLLDRVPLNDYSVDALVGGTTTINYRLTNRLLVRRQPAKGTVPAPGSAAAAGVVRDILDVDIGQTHYSDATAALYDPQYQSSGAVTQSTGTFSPLQITATTHPVDTMTGRFSMEIDSKLRAIRTLGANASIESAVAQVTAGWTKREVIPGLPGFDDPKGATHFLNANATMRRHDNRIGGTYAINYDIQHATFVQQRVMAYYNSQCCGISFDWQSITTPFLPVPSDRRFGVSFTLAGIGSFSNPLGSFGGR
jgi:hypothetical protein